MRQAVAEAPADEGDKCLKRIGNSLTPLRSAPLKSSLEASLTRAICQKYGLFGMIGGPGIGPTE
jgi:hypothetical protein